ncbi:MAG: DUF2378 family protein [Archangium sp.]|nr:DUF2378 family protein [Archangium sp.]
MSSERLIFEVSFRSLFDSLPQPEQTRVATAWKALGVDVTRLLPGYPAETWWRAVEKAAEGLAGTPEQRLRHLGRGLTDGFSRTLLGRATAPLARLTGTRRTLVRSPITFRSGNNYLQTVVEVEEPLRVRLRVNEVSPITDLLAGSIEGVVVFSGGFRPQVEVVRGETDTIYDVRWETDPG